MAIEIFAPGEDPRGEPAGSGVQGGDFPLAAEQSMCHVHPLPPSARADFSHRPAGPAPGGYISTRTGPGTVKNGAPAPEVDPRPFIPFLQTRLDIRFRFQVLCAPFFFSVSIPRTIS